MMLNEYHKTWSMNTDVRVSKGDRCSRIQQQWYPPKGRRSNGCLGQPFQKIEKQKNVIKSPRGLFSFSRTDKRLHKMEMPKELSINMTTTTQSKINNQRGDSE